MQRNTYSNKKHENEVQAYLVLIWTVSEGQPVSRTTGRAIGAIWNRSGIRPGSPGKGFGIEVNLITWASCDHFGFFLDLGTKEPGDGGTWKGGQEVWIKELPAL